MGHPSPWHVLKEEPLGDYRVFGVSGLRSRRERDGKEAEFFRVNAPDWTNIIALTGDDEVVMIRQFRHGEGETILELPGGMVDPEEDPREGARRELEEETGYRCGQIELLGVMNPNPALFGNRLHAYLATGCHPTGRVHFDEHEEVGVELVRRQDIPRLVRAGQVEHALVLGALAYWWVGAL